MTDAELFEFVDVFKHMRRVFPLRGEEHEMTEVARSYFKAMRRFSLTDVKSGADAWIARGERFPKPGQWIGSIPTRTKRVDLRAMSDAEAREYLRAEVSAYENPPCSCDLCVDEGIDHMPIRFVPNFDEKLDTEIKAFDPIRQRVVTTGHWAHGFELRRWYAAKAKFYEEFAKLQRARTIAPALGKPIVRREPGVEG